MHHNRLTAAMFGAIVAAASLTAGSAAATPLRPEAIAGDSHSSAVATRAAETLASYDAYTAAGGTTRLIRFIGDRNATADAVAVEFGLDAGQVRQAWSRAGASTRSRCSPRSRNSVSSTARTRPSPACRSTAPG